jgi:hypothetical protein
MNLRLKLKHPNYIDRIAPNGGKGKSSTSFQRPEDPGTGGSFGFVQTPKTGHGGG